MLGRDLPPTVAALPDDALAALDQAVDEAYRRQAAELRAARDDALKGLPWPLRKVVARILGA